MGGVVHGTGSMLWVGWSHIGIIWCMFGGVGCRGDNLSSLVGLGGIIFTYGSESGIRSLRV